jgi:hypothetical protein
MKKLIFIVAAVVLIAASCNKATPVDNSNQTGNNTPPPASVPTTQTYTNATYGIQFEYPLYMTFVTPSYANLTDKIVQVQIPRTEYSGTNFGDAAISVSAGTAKTLADCLKLSPPENGDGFKTKVVINGVDFYMTKSTGVGAGNLYESNIYRTVKSPGGACIEINETIHTSNIGNYTPGTVTEVNKTAVQTKLDSVLQSFKFTK